MHRKLARLTLTLSIVLASCAFASAAETDRDRDGLQGPVRRVRTESAKLVYKSGKLGEGERVTLETATYDMRGAKIDNAYFLATGGSLTGREVYRYDDRGNIVEMTLLNSDGSVMTKEKYDYEFDAMGNWTKMSASVAVVENGQTKFEPTEVTYRFISYFLEESVTKKLQPGQPQPAPAAAVAVNTAPAAAAPAPLSASTVAKTNVPVAAPPSSQSKVLPKSPAPPPALLLKSGAASVTLVAPDGMPKGSVTTASANAAPVVKSDEDLPPPVKKAPVRPISGGVLNGRAVSLPTPVYTEIARRARASGTVTVEVVVDVSGRVIAAKAVSGPVLLRNIAERAAMLARFTPALLSGQPVKVAGVINYSFTF